MSLQTTKMGHGCKLQFAGTLVQHYLYDFMFIGSLYPPNLLCNDYSYSHIMHEETGTNWLNNSLMFT